MARAAASRLRENRATGRSHGSFAARARVRTNAFGAPRSASSRREAAQHEVGELPGRAHEATLLGLAERPRERDAVERAERRARDEARRHVLAKLAGSLSAL